MCITEQMVKKQSWKKDEMKIGENKDLNDRGQSRPSLNDPWARPDVEIK
jgi:hypothetical protein